MVEVLIRGDVAVHADLFGPAWILAEFGHGRLTHEIPALHHLMFLGNGELVGPPGLFQLQSGCKIIGIRAA